MGRQSARRGRSGGPRRRPTDDGRDAEPTLRAGCPEDVLGVVPYLLGFHPTESMVLLALRRRRVELIARVDLPATGQPEPAEPESGETASREPGTGEPESGEAVGVVSLSAWPTVVRRVASAARSVGPSEIMLIGYSTVEGRAVPALDLAVEELADLPVIEVLHTDGQRWWSSWCDGDCCPPEGTPYAVDESRLAAEAVLAGLSPLRDRAALVASVAGPPTDQIARLERAATAALGRLDGLSSAARAAEMRRLVEAAGTTSGGLDPAVALRLAALATDLAVRDVAWALIDPDTASLQLALWTAVVRVTPPSLAPAPLCLLAVAAWVEGQGALMVCAFTRALELRPDYGMAVLLSDLNSAALPPRLWQEVVGPLRESLGLEVGV